MEGYIALIAAIIAIPTAIFALAKSYIDFKGAENSEQSTREGSNMQKSTSKSTVVSKSKDTSIIDKSTTIYGNVSYNADSNSKKKINTSDIDSIQLKERYTSLFAEDNKLKTEQIQITKQKNGEIEGIVTLIEKNLDGIEESRHTYTLKGKYTNKILTADYFSRNGNVDERGAINLKLIDKDILSGFCSFSKLATADDEIRVSPYVWVVGENKNLLDGTFDFCTQCYHEHKVCCCSSSKVDMPVFLNSELTLIRNQLPKKNTEKNTFSKNLSSPFQQSPVRQMKRDEKKDTEGKKIYTKCHFFSIEEQKCGIYDGRPIDCRLFPYDVKISENTREYVIGYYTELCARSIPDKTVMKKKAHILRPYFFLLYPYLHIITSEQVCERLNNADFEIIAKFNDFVF